MKTLSAVLLAVGVALFAVLLYQTDLAEVWQYLLIFGQAGVVGTTLFALAVAFLVLLQRRQALSRLANWIAGDRWGVRLDRLYPPAATTAEEVGAS